MKRLCILVLCCTLLVSAMPVYASELSPATESTNTVLNNRITVVNELIVEPTQARSTDKSATLRQTFYDGDTVIAIIAFQATFRYDGSSVSVVSKSVTQTDTYSGWSYTQDSFTSSGGTVTLSGKLKYLLLFNSSPFTMSMTCDANGNISY